MSEDYNIQEVASTPGDGGLGNAFETLRRTVDEQGRMLGLQAVEAENQRQEIAGLYGALRELLANRAVTNRTLGLVQDTVDILGRNLSDVWPLKASDAGDESDNEIDIRITGKSQDGSNFRWSYAWSEVEKSATGFGGWTTVTDGLSGTTSENTAYNTIEDGNGATGLMGNGVDTDNFPDGGTFALQPVPNGTVLSARKRVLGSTVEYHFQYENGVDGGCPS